MTRPAIDQGAGPAHRCARAAAGRASTLRVRVIHQDIRFSRGMANAVHAELAELACWLGLEKVDLPAADT